MDFRFTLFNSITLLIMGFTLLTGAGFVRRKISPNWAFLYYPLVLGYWKVFDGALNTWWLFTGIACALLLRFIRREGLVTRALWWIEAAALAYIFLRGLDLLLGGVLSYYFSIGRFAA
jgi:hypothetical protein